MRTLAALAATLLLASPVLWATPDARGEAEIRHLLDFVAGSGCTFIRNGDPHDAKSASEHLAMKYGKGRSRLKTAEQFIEHVASRSYFTGDEYRAQCPGQASQTSAVWLKAELQRWRAATARPAAAAPATPATTPAAAKP